MSEFSNELIRGTLKTLILKILEDRGKMYGYQMIKEVKSRTEGKIILTEGALYPALHILKNKGWVQVEEEMVANRKRKYYQLTTIGKNESVKKTLELLDFMRTIAGFIKSNT